MSQKHVAPIMLKTIGSRTFVLKAGALWYGEAIALITDLSASGTEGPMGESYALDFLKPDGTKSCTMYTCHESAAVHWVELNWQSMLQGVIERKRIDGEIAELLSDCYDRAPVDQYGCYIGL